MGVWNWKAETNDPGLLQTHDVAEMCIFDSGWWHGDMCVSALYTKGNSIWLIQNGRMFQDRTRRPAKTSACVNLFWGYTYFFYWMAQDPNILGKEATWFVSRQLAFLFFLQYPVDFHRSHFGCLLRDREVIDNFITNFTCSIALLYSRAL